MWTGAVRWRVINSSAIFGEKGCWRGTGRPFSPKNAEKSIILHVDSSARTSP